MTLFKNEVWSCTVHIELYIQYNVLYMVYRVTTYTVDVVMCRMLRKVVVMSGSKKKRLLTVLITSSILRYGALALHTLSAPDSLSRVIQDAGLMLGDIMLFPGEQQTRVSH